eukprot:1161503-Pelagomonas_calceolata.AAC.16
MKQLHNPPDNTKLSEQRLAFRHIKRSSEKGNRSQPRLLILGTATNVAFLAFALAIRTHVSKLFSDKFLGCQMNIICWSGVCKARRQSSKLRSFWCAYAVNCAVSL